MNVLKELKNSLGRQSIDFSNDKFLVYLYGVIMGWDDFSYKELQEEHNLTDDQIKHQKRLHKEYKELSKLADCEKEK